MCDDPSEAIGRRVARHLRPGDRVAVGDGVGTPQAAFAALAAAAGRSVRDLDLLLGWSFWLPDTDWSIYRSVTTLMGGHELRRPIADGTIRYVPARYGSLPALLGPGGPLRPDVVLVAARPTPDGLVLGTEVSWLGPALRHARTVLVEVNHGLPAATREAPLPADRVVVVAEVDRPPVEVPGRAPSPVVAKVGEIVAGLVPERATLQFAPGAVGSALLRSLEHPVTVDSGVVTDDVMDLDERGLLLGTPLAAYMVGTRRLYDWAHGRPMLAAVDITHDVSRLGRHEAFVAVNTALQIDRTGQVNVEAVGGDTIGGIGGHADYALGASRSVRGLSVVALASCSRGRSNLVDRLDAPTTTPRSDVDVVVTEHGWVDLRGLEDAERTDALGSVFP